jgi:hypothetical protein
MLLWGQKTLRPYLGAMSLGLGAYFLSQAGLGHVNVAWIPGHGLTDTLWLMCNGLMCLALGQFVIRHAGRNA